MTAAPVSTAMRTLDFAVAYAEHGMPIFPLWEVENGRCACRSRECRPESAGKHPISAGWQRSIASVTAARSTWRGRLGVRGIGLALGERAGMWALDVDPRHGGDVALAALERDYGALPESLRTATGGGGAHILFEWPTDGLRVTNANGLPAGLDTRGQGGFIVLPPSIHVSGERYRWTVPPRTGTLAAAPEWLLELVRQPQRSLSATADTGDAPTLVKGGDRYFALIRFCGLLRSAGLHEAAVVRCGHVFLDECCEQQPEMDREHAERNMRDVVTRYPARSNREER